MARRLVCVLLLLRCVVRMRRRRRCCCTCSSPHLPSPPPPQHTKQKQKICHEFSRFSEFMPAVKVSNFFGGIDIKKNKEELKKNPPSIVVGTPGRIKALGKEGALKLSSVRHFVLDECDKMLEKLDMRADVQEIFKMTPHQKQVMMFSATLAADVRPVCKKFMSDVSVVRCSAWRVTFFVVRGSAAHEWRRLARPAADATLCWSGAAATGGVLLHNTRTAAAEPRKGATIAFGSAKPTRWTQQRRRPTAPLWPHLYFGDAPLVVSAGRPRNVASGAVGCSCRADDDDLHEAL